ncbi:MAG: Spy/CpxP family protein refolding chaperone [Flavobacteriaceae bacterium]
MKKNLLLTLLLVFLVVMNGILLFLFFKKPGKRPLPPHEFVVKELRFTDEQMREYEKIRMDFDHNMRPLHRERMQLKEALFAKMSETDVEEKEIDSITALIGASEKERDMQVFNHFRAIYDLCDERQKEHFAKIVNRALRMPPGRKGQGPPPRP